MNLTRLLKNSLKKVPGVIKVNKILHKVKKNSHKLRFCRLLFEPFSYTQNGLYTIHNAEFKEDPSFRRYFREAEAETGWSHPAPWRCYVNVWAATHAARLEGDFVECGVYKGFTAHVLCRMIDIDSTGKQFYLVDSYEGLDCNHLSKAELELNMGSKNEQYRGTLPGVQKAFGKFKAANIIKGFVPQILPQVQIESVAYLHIDMNYVHPEIAAAEFFWEKMTRGSLMVLDDYGFKKHIEQKKAFDEFAARKGTLVLPIPTGQGLIIKY